MSGSSRGQVATEFFLYSAVFLIIVMAAYSAVSFIQSAEITNKETLYVKWFGERFASHMNTAMSSPPGFNYTMTFDKDIMRSGYVVQFKPSSVTQLGYIYITWSPTNYTYVYPIGNMSIFAGDNCIRQGGSGPNKYYNITPSKGVLSFYNNGTGIILSQGGC